MDGRCPAHLLIDIRPRRRGSLLAQVEIDINEPVRVVAIITRESLEELDLKPGTAATAVVKSTSVMVQR
jgi:molybdopterin-binding protein